ncbi:pyruvate, phosphate dikinase [Lentisphaera profundi]|uniref:Pyruvate, phosphate dikinase n=2 Tax=Lentisphaera profundi TaxID=1658616 RepID=A0ABY7VRC9_9BACT|nr:pyruvate, phosphate dikinase [Lentisphaera profundi]WDE95442.1 pyruvate, phosphate dikinase [Lentisphaera profundi]
MMKTQVLTNTTGTETEINPFRVYHFGKVQNDGNASMRNLLGGKGANLAEMSSIGIPVPPGFTIPTSMCTHYNDNQQQLADALMIEVDEAITLMEQQTATEFGSLENPLLVSVRSGARVSMPGMMDTVLNLGLTDIAVIGLANKTNNARMAYDSYRRFIVMYSEVVKGMDAEAFEELIDAAKSKAGVSEDTGLSVEDLKELCLELKKLYTELSGDEFPQDPKIQLRSAIEAVFDSWNTERAVLYRKIQNIPASWGTAVNVQAMVFGNKGASSATGVAFTRNPSTGDKTYFGEYLINAQGEDVVAGVRTPLPISKESAAQKCLDGQSMEETMPKTYVELTDVFEKLEKHYADMQDVEFTVEEEKLYILQTRNGKRSGFAQVRMAVEMVEEGLVDEKTALARIEPSSIEQMLSPIFNLEDKANAASEMVGKGLNAGPGAASGVLALTSAKAIEYKQLGVPCVLVRNDTSPADFGGMMAAEGVLTVRGGATSHAAVVARQFGKPCVCGLAALKVKESTGEISIGDKKIKEGDAISLDGSTGEVFFCKIETSASEVIQGIIDGVIDPNESEICKQYQTIMTWADKYRRLKIRTNADTSRDLKIALSLGAEGVGLTRVEHMFGSDDKLLLLRQVMLAKDEQIKTLALSNIEHFLKEDFTALFQTLNGRPATVRLLDPPMHEFMPHGDADTAKTAKALKITDAELRASLGDMEEHNPMLGFRGCRLGILKPELTRVQVRAILEAALELNSAYIPCKPEIMVPIIMHENELIHQRTLIDKVAQDLFAELGQKVSYSVGTMIELPRAALQADEIAKHADFFSFGTNDLTQTTLGISRDDANHFLPTYKNGVSDPLTGTGNFEVYPDDPFQTLDQSGVGKLVQLGVKGGRSTSKDLKIGICGEHGGDPASIDFFHRNGLDYVSCSPFRVPVARLSAALSAIRAEEVE